MKEIKDNQKKKRKDTPRPRLKHWRDPGCLSIAIQRVKEHGFTTTDQKSDSMIVLLNSTEYKTARRQKETPTALLYTSPCGQHIFSPQPMVNPAPPIQRWPAGLLHGHLVACSARMCGGLCWSGCWSGVSCSVVLCIY